MRIKGKYVATKSASAILRQPGICTVQSNADGANVLKKNSFGRKKMNILDRNSSVNALGRVCITTSVRCGSFDSGSLRGHRSIDRPI